MQDADPQTQEQAWNRVTSQAALRSPLRPLPPAGRASIRPTSSAGTTGARLLSCSVTMRAGRVVSLSCQRVIIRFSPGPTWLLLTSKHCWWAHRHPNANWVLVPFGAPVAGRPARFAGAAGSSRAKAGPPAQCSRSSQPPLRPVPGVSGTVRRMRGASRCSCRKDQTVRSGWRLTPRNRAMLSSARAPSLRMLKKAGNTWGA